LGLAGERRHSHRRGALQIAVGAMEHADRAGDMKAADRHRDVSLTQRLGEVERARELVRLNSDQHHHARAGDADHRGGASPLMRRRLPKIRYIRCISTTPFWKMMTRKLSCLA